MCVFVNKHIRVCITCQQKIYYSLWEQHWDQSSSLLYAKEIGT